MRRKIWLVLIVSILLVAGGSFLYFKGFPNSIGDKNKTEKMTQDYPFENPDLKARYDDEKYNFFVDYPEKFIANAIDESETRVVVFDNKDPKSKNESFQIFIMPYDEPGPITPERILIDEPKMVIKDAKIIRIAGEDALIFFSLDADIGDVREVWFVHGDHLYQASTYAKYDELLSKVMRTFRFK